MQDFCPRCRARRIGAFRFCRSCRFDFDTPGANDGAPAGQAPASQLEGKALALNGDRLFPAGALLALAFVLVIGSAGLSTGVWSNGGSPKSVSSTTSSTPRTEQQVAAAPITTPSATPSAIARLGAGPSGQTTRAKVVRVIDAQTILVAFGGRRYDVRYVGVDTPATVGRGALAANKALVADETVILEAGVENTDRSGRLLRYVWVHHMSKWTLVNLELVRRGWAMVATHSPDKKYADGFVAAEREARTHQLGLWSRAPKPRATPEPIRKPTPKPSKK